MSVRHRRPTSRVVLLGAVRVVGSYSAHFVRAHVVYLHMAFSSAVTCTLGILAWHDGVPPVTAFSATLALLVAVNGTVTLHHGYTSDLQRTLKHQLRMANTDPLTGLLNRRGFVLATSTLLRRGGQGGDRFALLIADVDRFKRINDDHGHGVGDLVLQQVAEILQGAVDEPAVVARLGGGDEFAIAMRLDEAAARAVAEDIRGQPIDTEDGEWATVSLGIAVGPLPPATRCPTRMQPHGFDATSPSPTMPCSRPRRTAAAAMPSC